jgi:hypothetical protein
MKEAEKEKLRLLDEKEEQRIKEQLAKAKFELEEEERRKREKEIAASAAAEEAKRIAEEKAASFRKGLKNKKHHNNDNSNDLQTPPQQAPSLVSVNNYQRSESPTIEDLKKNKNLRNANVKKPSIVNNSTIIDRNLTHRGESKLTNYNNNNKNDFYQNESRLNVNTPVSYNFSYF